MSHTVFFLITIHNSIKTLNNNEPRLFKWTIRKKIKMAFSISPTVLVVLASDSGAWSAIIPKGYSKIS